MLHILGGRMHGLVWPAVVGQGCVRQVLAPVAPTPGHVAGQVPFQGLDGSIYHCQSVPIRGILHSVHHGVRQRPLQAIEFNPFIRGHNVIGLLLHQLRDDLPGCCRNRLCLLIGQGFGHCLSGENVRDNQPVRSWA